LSGKGLTSTQNKSASEETVQQFSLRPVRGSDADALFPLIHRRPVTDTILWDGPLNLTSYREGLLAKEKATHEGKEHMFTLLASGRPAGSCSFRPEEDNDFRADIGLWIGEAYQGKGLGSFAVKELVKYGFQMPKIKKIEAGIFVGNTASRRIFEKSGFRLEGTIRLKVEKRGKWLDEWLLGLLRSDYEG
jgi:RimJ/RimL family protein N-acetyltransferase